MIGPHEISIHTLISPDLILQDNCPCREDSLAGTVSASFCAVDGQWLGVPKPSYYYIIIFILSLLYIYDNDEQIITIR